MRFRGMHRTIDSQGSYQSEAAVEQGRIVKAAVEQFLQPSSYVAGVGEAMIAQGKRDMAEFKSASARRWGRESKSAAATEDRARVKDKSLPAIKRFIAASRLFRSGR